MRLLEALNEAKQRRTYHEQHKDGKLAEAQRVAIEKMKKLSSISN